VALCSASFLFSKSDVIGDGGLEKLVFFGIKILCVLFSLDLAPLAKFGLPPNLDDFFSINTVFFDCDLVRPVFIK